MRSVIQRHTPLLRLLAQGGQTRRPGLARLVATPLRRTLIAAPGAPSSSSFTASASSSPAAATTGEMEVYQFPCLQDNYSFLLHDPSTGATAVVDTPEVAPIEAALKEKGWKLTHILNTHHHWDHTGGNEQLLQAFPDLEVYGHRSDDGRIFGQTQRLDDGDVVHVGHHKARILFIPGHTTGSIAYHFRDDVFTGDALFVAGCGRVFEGNPVMMHNSLQRLTALHPQTRVWVGHEYTEANLTFAQTVEPENQAIQKALLRAQAARAQGLPTIPSSVELELQINPFLRASSAEVFAERRALKDAF